MITNQITKEEVLEVLEYEQESGIFRWKNPRQGIATGSVAGWNHAGGYRRIQIKESQYLIHRLVWLVETGVLPDSDIDHIDRDKSNNRFSNLRIATNSQNQQNTNGRSDNTSGFKGVHFHKATKKYSARIRINGERKELGLFETAELAHHAYKAASLEYHRFGIYAKDTPQGDATK